MIKIILFVVFSLVHLKIKACNELNIVCRTVCLHDGDQKGVVIDGKCYCANYRTLDDVITRVPKNGGQVANKTPKYSYFE